MYALHNVQLNVCGDKSGPTEEVMEKLRIKLASSFILVRKRTLQIICLLTERTQGYSFTEIMLGISIKSELLLATAFLKDLPGSSKLGPSMSNTS